jgi:hypothetical protein
MLHLRLGAVLSVMVFPGLLLHLRQQFLAKLPVAQIPAPLEAFEFFGLILGLSPAFHSPGEFPPARRAVPWYPMLGKHGLYPHARPVEIRLKSLPSLPLCPYAPAPETETPQVPSINS